MPPRKEEIDYVCSECGKVTAGPHKGERIPTIPTETSEYKGSPISHAICDDCRQRFVDEAKRRHNKIRKF